MAIYRIPQAEIDAANKELVLSVIRFYTYKYGGADLDKINPTTLVSRFGIKLADAKIALQSLISEGKVVKVV